MAPPSPLSPRGKNRGVMIDTLSRGIDAIAGRLRQIAAGYDRTILFTAGSLDAGCDSARR
jgi:hypothetical protein